MPMHRVCSLHVIVASMSLGVNLDGFVLVHGRLEFSKRPAEQIKLGVDFFILDSRRV